MTNTTTPHDRYRYTCAVCQTAVTVVIPLRTRLFSEYWCEVCRQMTRMTVDFLPGTDRLARQQAQAPQPQPQGAHAG